MTSKYPPEIRVTFIVYKLTKGRTDVAVKKEDIYAEAQRLNILKISDAEFEAMCQATKAEIKAGQS
jgi:hypothetical protein